MGVGRRACGHSGGVRSMGGNRGAGALDLRFRTCGIRLERASALIGDRARRATLVGLVAALIAGTSFLGIAAATPSPLTIKILRATTNGQLQGVWQLEVLVENHSERTLRPHFCQAG